MLSSPLRSTSADGTSLFTSLSVAHPVARPSSVPPTTPSTSRPLTKLRCLLVVTSRGTDTTPLQTAIAQLRRVSPCSSTAVMHVCKAAPKAERTEWHCVPMGRGRQCTKTSPTAVAKGCDVVLPDTGQECHGLLRTLVVGYRWFGGGGPRFDRLVSIPATMLTRSSARRNRLLQIVSSLRRVDSYYDATGVGFAIRENATYELWKGARLTPAQPQPIVAEDPHRTHRRAPTSLASSAFEPPALVPSLPARGGASVRAMARRTICALVLHARLASSSDGFSVELTAIPTARPLGAFCANGNPRCFLKLSSRMGKLWANGEELHLKGINWFGSESRTGAPDGLGVHTVEYYMDFLSLHGFNAVRLLFNHESVIKDGVIEPATAGKAAELVGLSYLEMFQSIAERAASRGILVMIACHRLRPDAWPGGGLWYDEFLDEGSVLRSWELLCAALCAQWNVVAADLQNEPHASSWGRGAPATDWDTAAARIGNRVLELCPRWLIMVEGVGFKPGAPSGDDAAMGLWWGENLIGAKAHPVRLKNPVKLVYSPHTYGPSVYMQKYFEDAGFPGNMPEVWESHFASAIQSTSQAIVIGEMGGRYVGKDKVWQDWAIGYAVEHHISVFYFCLNPGSADTGGILTADWTTPDEHKLSLLSRLPTTRIQSLIIKHPPSAPPPISTPAEASASIAAAAATSSALPSATSAPLAKPAASEATSHP
ncbi:hypothetical protein AB1Y20_013076 [Prymnesium parvum]|uniref:Glycoside hydrolase family 5 domain-containing protein n=1 Tax=Prymnesium parvum TaxID=97485 RepID=A0AB34IJM5_PRYPA